MQLATVAVDGTPRVRTMAFRGWGGPASLDLVTDGRCAKTKELQQQAAVELCWLLPRARCQFRLRGAVLTLLPELEEQERQRHRQQLTPGGRALWGRPPPGAPLDPDASISAELPNLTPVSEQFRLLRIGLQQVELLELSGHPHQRRRWRLADPETDEPWLEERLNP